MNLNHARLPADGPSQPLQDPSTRLAGVDAEVVFRDLQPRLVAMIESYPVVVGCVAWLTSGAILDALATRQAVSIIVQKEDFLRPDHDGDRTEWARRLRQRYAYLEDAGPPLPTRYVMPAPLCNASVCSTPTIEPIRCVGNHNSSRSPAHPRMHNKFLIFGRMRGETEWNGLHDVEGLFYPEAVWTGSFNLTETASNSFENAVIIRDERIAAAYALEYAQIAVLSEPLDWDTDWMAPEWRIGT
jgi:phosphatidylserine/phosphatidylglycerophosphate/cardiolipin synthase-like enzyme